MQQTKILATSVISALVLGTQAYALPIGKPINTTVVVTNPTKGLKYRDGKKEITVMSIQLSNKQKENLFNYQPQPSNANISLKSKRPSAVSLGMNRVPVLDQGRHGTCVTFATSAALDAVIGNGDYVSPLCSLSVGKSLEENSYMPSGWDGSWGSIVLEQMMRFGIVNKNNQLQKSCGGLKDYPLNDGNNQGEAMSLSDYKAISENLDGSIYWVAKLNFNQRLEAMFDDNIPEKALQDTKNALSAGHRLTFGTFLVLSPYCSAGACASHNALFDTWALTKEISTPPYELGGHEMVITGFDDNATAVDQQGKKHKGLLTLRNSWSDEVGDAGNYYMTYDYFKKFVIEVQEIVPADQSHMD